MKTRRKAVAERISHKTARKETKSLQRETIFGGLTVAGKHIIYFPIISGLPSTSLGERKRWKREERARIQRKLGRSQFNEPILGRSKSIWVLRHSSLLNSQRGPVVALVERFCVRVDGGWRDRASSVFPERKGRAGGGGTSPGCSGRHRVSAVVSSPLPGLPRNRKEEQPEPKSNRERR